VQGVQVEYVAKLFTKLQKADLVVATEGVRGGFRLARQELEMMRMTPNSDMQRHVANWARS
jgi:DNA-binding IscR family transcriptional regulator